jgi:aminocarboxymuconate-semialdehyde decarboxylase
MTDRRKFLAGVCFAAGSFLPAATRRRGVRAIDVHAHCVIPEAMAMMGAVPDSPGLVMAPERLQRMDKQGIDMQVLSILQPAYSLDRDLAARATKLQNESLAELCAQHPDRFAGLASVALQFPDPAAEQLVEAAGRLGLRGVAIGGNVNGEELSNPRFHPFWAKAEELAAPVFIHPRQAGFPVLQKQFQGNGMLTGVIGAPLETTLALSHLIFEGTLDRFPRLKIYAAHGGGFLPSYSGRFDRGCPTYPDRCSPAPLNKRPSEYLRGLYFDALVFTSEGLRHLVAECGASQIMMGTDYPYPWTANPVDHILQTPGLSHADRAAILGGNAAKLLRLT